MKPIDSKKSNAKILEYVQTNFYDIKKVYDERLKIMRFLKDQEELASMKEKPDINKVSEGMVNDMGEQTPIYKRARQIHENKMKAIEES